MYTPPSARASAAYRQVDLNSRVLSASPHSLITLLFDELSRCLSSACVAIERRDVATKARYLGKAIRLLDEGLLAGLDMNAGGEVAASLHQLYSYCLMRLAQAQAQNDASIVQEIQNVLQPVMDAWSEIGGRAHA
ncbi:flagellar export chaperone FliS [Melaminivora alkalimesophila]|uniref:Flagellar secretion chaperone FliS n=1 Tax=Melaminivora alkalimesophila TaxID=1165852 RepID=A0A317RBB8_9BURK|nr:flagellar export chaperone FliS [Melaminivora alkalimesophila]PWW44456.1 flagellar protein FliS [Melaminivora alkalimesophila]